MIKALIYILVTVFIGLVSYAATGYISGITQSGSHKERARNLIAAGKGADKLGADKLDLLLRVQDPGFYQHQGIDIKTSGAGLTTITQSLAKRLAFYEFKPGPRKIRQSTYAMALESKLAKAEILALFLETVPMGQGPDGWINGFFDASHGFYQKPPDALNRDQFIELISVMIAPSRLNPLKRDSEFLKRVQRIDQLDRGKCSPINNKDVWLLGCDAVE